MFSEHTTKQQALVYIYLVYEDSSSKLVPSKCSQYLKAALCQEGINLFIDSEVLVVVRLTTCKRLTNNSLPKLSITTLFPPETAGYIVCGRPDIRADLSISKPFNFLGIPIILFFFKFDMDGENLKSLLLRVLFIVDGGTRTHDPKTYGLATTPFVK